MQGRRIGLHFRPEAGPEGPPRAGSVREVELPPIEAGERGEMGAEGVQTRHASLELSQLAGHRPLKFAAGICRGRLGQLTGASAGSPPAPQRADSRAA